MKKYESEAGSYMITLKREMVITNEMIEDLLVGCFEGGSTYWITEVVSGDWKGQTHASDVVTAGGSMRIFTGETNNAGMPEFWELDLDKMLKGIRKYFEEMGARAVDFENMDAGDNDNVLQFALFGELVYG